MCMYLARISFMASKQNDRVNYYSEKEKCYKENGWSLI